MKEYPFLSVPKYYFCEKIKGNEKISIFNYRVGRTECVLQ